MFSLHLNISKTIITVILRTPKTYIYMSRKKQEQVTSMKYLGPNLDSSVTRKKKYYDELSKRERTH